MTRTRFTTLLILAATVTIASADAQQWQPAAGPLMTRWAAEVTPDRVLPEYPRPQLVRRDWLNLNGLWDYAVRPRADATPTTFDGRILVPFPIESALSGVMKKVGESNRLWYHRTFAVPAAWRGRRTLLHFDAVDWEATVIVNGTELTTHRGGYDRFTVDITDALRPSGAQEVVVAVWDPTDTGTQPRGKQVNRPSGIWYTSVTGIWQTVWIEPVPEAAINTLELTPDVDAGTLTIKTTPVPIQHSRSFRYVELTAVVRDGSREVGRTRGAVGDALSVRVPNAKLWSPDAPALYGLNLTVRTEDENIDSATSYFAMRKSSLCKDDAGVLRLCLNNKPL